MTHPDVGQAAFLSAQLAALLAQYAPASLALAGCAGGNGLEHVDPRVTPRVVAIDINPAYVQAVAQRHGARLRGLELHVADIEAPALSIAPVDLVYAALLFEHVEIGAALRTLGAVCRAGGILASVLQQPQAGSPTVTATPFRSLEQLGTTMQLLEPAQLAAAAAAAGFSLVRASAATLPSGRRFALQVFRR
jgi:hypothetical protein